MGLKHQRKDSQDVIFCDKKGGLVATEIKTLPKKKHIRPMMDSWEWHIYRYTWMVDFYGKLAGEYTSPMDPVGYGFREIPTAMSPDKKKTC